MEIFKPYKVIVDSSTELHLAETDIRRKFLFFYFRIFPLILVGLLIPVLTIDDMPGDIKLFMAIPVGLLAVLFLNRKYVTEVKISRQFIETHLRGFSGAKQNAYVVNDIEKITVTVFRGKGGGFFYKLKPKHDKPVPLFTIPRLYMNSRNLPLINEKLEAVTGLIVEEKA